MLLLLMLIPIIFGYFFFKFNKNKGVDTNFTKTELRLILKDDIDKPMRVLNYFNHKDSLILRTQSSDIDNFTDKNLTIFIDRLMTTAINSPNDLGIAAPQVGVNKKLIIMQRLDKAKKPFEIYLNPQILAYSEDFILVLESCQSIPNIKGNTYRAEWIEISYYTIEGIEVIEKITDAVISQFFQQKTDYLDGIVFLDRMSKD